MLPLAGREDHDARNRLATIEFRSYFCTPRRQCYRSTVSGAIVLDRCADVSDCNEATGNPHVRTETEHIIFAHVTSGLNGVDEWILGVKLLREDDHHLVANVLVDDAARAA